MNDERDPALEALFSAAEKPSPNGDFASRVMSRVDSRRRNVFIVRVAVVALIAALELLLSAPFSGVMGMLADRLTDPLISLNDSWLAWLISPLNSAAGVVGVILLLLHFLYRKVIR